MANRIAIIILNYNNAPDTISCVESVLTAKYSNDHCIIVVDNCSSDDSYEKIKKHFSNVIKETNCDTLALPRLSIIKSVSNKGYAAGNNIGLRRALKDSSIQYFWILNNDTELHQDCIWEIDQYLTTKPANEGVTATLLALFDNRDKLQLLGAKYYPYLGMSKPYFMDHELYSIDAKKIKETLPKIDYLIGASLIFTRSILEDVGLFNEAFFLYMEELDYITRAKKRNWKIGISERALVYHKVGGTTKGGKSRNKARSPFLEYHQCRSKLIYTKTFYPFYYPAVFIMLVGHLLRQYSFKLNVVYPVVKKLVTSSSR